MVDTTAYSNRVYDLSMLQGVNDMLAVRVDQSLFGNNGEVCTGVQKLAQQWLILFMTELGSMGHQHANRGTMFMYWARSGYIRVEFDVRTYFNFAAQDVYSQMRAAETVDMPADERLQNAELIGFQIFEGQLSLSIHIISLAGAAREVILPINMLPAPLRLPE